ncbi:MAG: hypothetical protein JSS02_06760 [Planctomycetes bacterium]|nr:hypothetical protein [Planctomycetota bacterium]
MRNRLLLAWVVCVLAIGCQNEPPPKPAPIKVSHDDVPDEPPEQSEPPLDDDDSKPAAGEKEAQATGPMELKLPESPLTFQIPAGWRKVKPENNIVEAEFELPRATGDEFDGRLLLMSSGGEREQNIQTRVGEFQMEPGDTPSRDSVSVGGVDSILVDIRGTWGGPSHRPISPARPGYRMLYVIVPLGERSSFYVKLYGPRATLAAHEEAFREFLKSAVISK